MLIKSILVLITFMVISVYSQTKPETLTIKGTIYDHYPDYNDNFQYSPTGSDVKQPGMVQTILNDNPRIPLLNTSNTQALQKGTLVAYNSFQWFFQSNLNAPKSKNSGLNYPIPIEIVLKLDPKTGSYVFNEQAYFPIDTKGFDQDPSFIKYKQGNTFHNFHFCLRINSRFTYSGNEIFNFVGDDDVWVFIDNKLVVDLGGVHPPQTGNVDLKTLGLTPNKVYNFDFYYCERHTDGSSIKIETTIEAYCPWYDYCGVCTGDGSTCCNPKAALPGQISCDDGKPCTIDKCPSPDTKIEAGKTLKDYCENTPKVCSSDKCNTPSCNANNGSCVLTPISPPDRSDECLEYVRCDPNNGFIYKSTCTSLCQTGQCLGKGVCQSKNSTTCANELGGEDKCKVFSCSIDSGCTSKPTCPQGNNPCIKALCNNGDCSEVIISPDKCNCGCPANTSTVNPCKRNSCDLNGNCLIIDIDGIDDGNPCTDDLCTEVDGKAVITHTQVSYCGGCMQCDPTSVGGLCIAKDEKCDDNNKCTIDKCLVDKDSNHGTCANITRDCASESSDLCLEWECTPDGGCQSSPKVCPDSGNCMVGFCDSKKGCDVKPKDCSSPHFCIVGECDETIGCISYDRVCASDDNRCKKGICYNATETEEGQCRSVNYDPLPFICKTAAVVSTAVIAGVTVAGAVAAAIFIYGGKKGYDYWKEHRDIKFTGSNSNPLYEVNKNNMNNPLYNDDQL